MNCKSHILLLLTVLCGFASFSQNIEFIENKGQWDNQVRFMGQVSNGAFYVHKDGFTVLQHNSADWDRLHQATHKKGSTEPLIVRSHAYRVEFLNTNGKSQIIADKELPTYNNYFVGDDPSKWAAACKIYQGITVKNLYPNIDVRYYSDRGMLKYDLLVHPGGDLSNIALKYNGTDGLRIKNKELVIATSVGELKELVPYTYQYNDKGKTEISAKYSLKDNIVRFDIKGYDPKTTLIIDPSLVFCSFTGSNADNWGFTATYGPDGSMYGGGIVFGSGFPVSTGAFQTNFGGGGNCFGGPIDIGIIKLTPDGSNRVYATYIGGSGDEMPQSMIVDPQGQLIVAGKTNSPMTGAGSYPVTSTFGPGGKFDITITKLNAAGTGIIGSVRIGGSEDDGANINPCGGQGAVSLQRNYGDEARSEVIIDAGGNVYLASCTQSDNFFTQNAFQTSKSGAQDAVVLKMNPTLNTVLFSSFLGGSGNDAAYVLAIGGTGQVYVAGGTESSNLPGSTAGTVGPGNHGSIDGFISTIPASGGAITRTTYIGTAAIDQIYGIQFDRLGFPYIMGQTLGSWPVTPGVWSTPNGKQFICKLQPDLSAFVYSTVFGKVSGGEAAPDISPVAFLVDRCENVYVSGWGGKVGGDKFPAAGVQGLPVTPDAIKSNPDINQTSHLGEDFYFFVLKKDAATQLYGSFFGQNNTTSIGDHVDGGTSRFDSEGVIYQAICANCSNNSPFPTTPGVWAPTKPPSVTCNLAMVKIAFNLAGVNSGVQSFINGRPRDTAGCVPLTVDFIDTIQNAQSYEWYFGDGSTPSPVRTTVPVVSHTFTAVGTYQVMLIGIDSSTCNIRDTSYLTIKVSDLRAQLDFNPVKLNPCDSFKYRFDNLSVAPPTRPFGSQSFKWIFGDNTPPLITGPGPVFHNYASAGTYNVQLVLNDSGYCNYPDTMIKQLRVAALVEADFDTPPNGCAPYNASFANTSQAGAQFIWDFGDPNDPTPSNAINPTHLYANPGTYTITLVAIDSATCNIIDTTRFTITVYDKPTPGFTASPQPPTVNTAISFTNLSSADAVRFKWLFGDGDSLVTTSRAVVQHEYNATGTFNACLIAFNPAGCADTVCQPVQTLIEPAVDVPNAFTPGQQGANSTVYVRGFGIAKMKFSVWARWGEKVFESGSKNQGWNGYYKGKLLPMDVYAYTLEVEFSDGTKTTKSGDITLIR